MHNPKCLCKHCRCLTRKGAKMRKGDYYLERRAGKSPYARGFSDAMPAQRLNLTSSNDTTGQPATAPRLLGQCSAVYEVAGNGYYAGGLQGCWSNATTRNEKGEPVCARCDSEGNPTTMRDARKRFWGVDAAAKVDCPQCGGSGKIAPV